MLWTPGRHRRSTPDSARFRPVDDLGVDTPLHPQAWGRPELRPQLSPGARCRVHTVSTGFSTGRGRSAHRVVPKMWTLLTACRRGVRGPRVYQRGHGPERPPERSSTGSRAGSRTRSRSVPGTGPDRRPARPAGASSGPRGPFGPPWEPSGAPGVSRGPCGPPAAPGRAPVGPDRVRGPQRRRMAGGTRQGPRAVRGGPVGVRAAGGPLEGRWRAGDARSAPPVIRRRPAS